MQAKHLQKKKEAHFMKRRANSRGDLRSFLHDSTSHRQEMEGAYSGQND
jgi:hypothetical protein